MIIYQNWKHFDPPISTISDSFLQTHTYSGLTQPNLWKVRPKYCLEACLIVTKYSHNMLSNSMIFI